MKRMGCTEVSAASSVLQGRAQVTLTPSLTSRAAAARLSGVIRLMVPSSSSLPQRLQLDRVRMYSRTCASVGTGATGAMATRLAIPLSAGSGREPGEARGRSQPEAYVAVRGEGRRPEPRAE